MGKSSRIPQTNRQILELSADCVCDMCFLDGLVGGVMNNHLFSTLFLLEQQLFSHTVWLGVLSCFFIFAANLKPESRLHWSFWFMAALSVLAPILHISAKLYFGYATNGEIQLPIPIGAGLIWLELWLGSGAFALLWLRFAPQRWNTALEIIKKTTQLERNHKTDVRTIHEVLPKPAELLDFNPMEFFDTEKGIFLGMDEKHQPVYIQAESGGSIPHVGVIGTTGAGKGVSLGVIAAQFIDRSEAVFFLDPKNDDHAPHVLFLASEKSKRPYHFINLNRPNGPQLNLFQGATEEEAFELFIAGFALSDKGDTSDFYGIEDRYQAGLTAKLIAEKKFNLAQAYTARRDELMDVETGAKKIAGRLRELSEVPSINAIDGEGVNITEVIDKGGAVYIVGSMRNDIIKTIQRMLLVRLIQLAERRDRIAGTLRPVCIVLDEVKYHLSRPALEALGAARDKGVHVMLTHQSVGDLRDCPKDLDGDAVVDAIVENCAVKLCYRVRNPITAEWLAAMSGKIQADDEIRKVRRNLMQAETVDPERSIRQAERFFIDSNMLLRMPKGVGVLYDNGLARLVSIRPVAVKKSRAAITIKTVTGASAPSARDAIAL